MPANIMPANMNLVPPPSIAVALTASPSAATVYISIDRVVRVSLRALSRQDALDATATILSIGHGFKMKWVHTSAVPAEMIGLEARRKGADETFVSPAMSASHPLATIHEYSIAIRPACGHPLPAPVIEGVNITPETGIRRNWLRPSLALSWRRFCRILKEHRKNSLSVSRSRAFTRRGCYRLCSHYTPSSPCCNRAIE